MFNIGDKVFNPENPNKIYTIIDVNIIIKYIPKYTLLDEDGETEWENYCLKWYKVVTDKEVIKYGNILTDDSYYIDSLNGGSHRIRILSYDNRIFYHKMVNGEVVEFKELTV